MGLTAFVLTLTQLVLETPAPASLVVQSGHGYGVVAIAVSGDGRLLAASEHYSGLVKVWDLRSGLQLATHQRPFDAPALAFTPDGDLVTVDVHQNVMVFDPATGAERSLLQRQVFGEMQVVNPRPAFAVGPRGQVAVSGFIGDAVSHTADLQDIFSTAKAVRIWPIQGEQPFVQLLPDKGTTATAAAFSSDGRLMALGLDDGEVLVVDLRTRATRWRTRIEGTSGDDRKHPVNLLLWHEDGRRLVAVTDQRLVILGAQGKPLSERALEVEVHGLAPAGRHEFLLAARDTLLSVRWQNAAVRRVGTFDGGLGPIAALPEPGRFAVVAGRDIVIWDKPHDRVLRRLGSRTTGIAMAAMSEGRTVLVAEGDRLARWQLDTNAYTPFEVRLPGRVVQMEGGASRGRPVLVVSRRDTADGGQERHLSAVDIARGKIRWSRRLDAEDPQFSPDGLHVGILEGRRQLRFLDAASGEDVALIPIGFAFTFSFDGADSVLTGPRHDPIRRWAWRAGRDPTPTKVVDVSEAGPVTNLVRSGDGRLLAWSYPEGWRVGLANLAEKKSFDFVVNGRILAFSPVEPLLAVGTSSGEVVMFDAERRLELRRFRVGDGIVDTLSFSEDGLRLVAGARDGAVHVLSPTAHLVTAFFRDDARVVFTPEGFYAGDREAMDAIGFRIGRSAYPFEQLDLEFHRPDRVLTRLEGDPQVIAAYEAAWRSRTRRMGVDAPRTARPPNIAIDRSTVPLASASPSITVRVEAQDDAESLATLHVFANDVPIHGASGRAIATPPGRRWRGAVELALTEERTKVQIFVRNAAGVDSLRETFDVRRLGPGLARDLWIVAVGVSEYPDPTMRLSFAAKDARDIAEVLSAGAKGRFERVRVLPLLDTDATRKRVLGIRAQLEQSRPQDEVVLFVAGHGLVDEHLSYRFATFDMDFARPTSGGVTFDELEGLLDGIPARRKLLMMDTCHAGELDAQDIKAVAEAPGARSPRTFPRGLVAVGGEPVAALTRSRLLDQLFIDLRRGAGATVLAASAGAEFAFESGDWRNGAFTLAARRGLACGAADSDDDGVVDVSELLRYVATEVNQMTRGRQQPVARRLNQTHDYPLAHVPRPRPSSCSLGASGSGGAP